MKGLAILLVPIVCFTYMSAEHQAIPKRCTEVPVIGSCHPLKATWFYDANSQHCKTLEHGVCARGSNLFPTQNQCMKTCIPMTTQNAKICLRPPIQGPCGPVFVAYYFDYLEHHCKVFNRTICAEGVNDFATEQKCQATCLHKQKPLCSLHPKSGKCWGSNLRWYFQESSNVCHLFPRNQCGANHNAFASAKKCVDRCSYRKAPVRSTSHEQIDQETKMTRNRFGRSSLRKLISRS
ncbi:kunitz-type serine protease inhibitor bitisilin-3-like isoform X2 [Dermacentor variabilis]|uniref:kunitz-type serine protease inhibitor bitisilin-3-like isoform X2 n=1 Tax=Dermacentor variabilis TaxID=34621 RepID=UPI003F5BF215